MPERKKIKREVVNEGKTYSGILKKWKRKQKCWEIKIKEKIEYKEHQALKIIHANKWDLDVKENLRQKAKVTFKVYLCEKGLAAFQVKKQSNPIPKEEKEARDEPSPAESDENLKNTEIPLKDKIK